MLLERIFTFDFLPSVLLLLLISLLIGSFWTRTPKNAPPGPRGLPLVGYAPFLGKNPFEAYMKLMEKYGPVISVPIGTSNWIILNSFDAINEAFVKKAELFSDRPSMMQRNGRYGVATIDYGPVWKNFRRFGSTTLRGFGVGKKSMEESIVAETPHLIENLTSESEDSLKTKFALAVSNIICGVVFGSRFSYDNKKFRKMNDAPGLVLASTMTAKLNGLVTLVPVLQYFPPFKGAVKFIHKEMKDFTDIMQNIIDEHMATYNENEMRDFTDAFLREMKQNGPNSDFSNKHLLQYIRDLFFGGSGTTSSTLHWSMLALVHYPECQEKLAEEIHDVFGENCTPSMERRNEMPYTCAFIQEIMRHRTLFPLSVPHTARAGAAVGGYTIPSGSTVVANLWAVHFDPNSFSNPREFRPERFIDADGKFIPSNHVIPFSVGPRHCLGEQLAKMEVFIFLTGIVQRLRVMPDGMQKIPPLDDGGFNMFTYEGPDFKVKFEHR